MKATVRKLHLASGLILLVIFPLTGAYMRYRIPHLMQESDRLRFSLRGHHVYILLSGLIHLSLGVYLRPMATTLLKRLQTVASALLILASVILVAGFFYEPKSGLDRPVTLIAMVMMLVGTLLHFLGSLISKEEPK